MSKNKLRSSKPQDTKPVEKSKGKKPNKKSKKKIKKDSWLKRNKKAVNMSFGILFMVVALYSALAMVSYTVNTFNGKVDNINLDSSTVTSWQYLMVGNGNNFTGNLGDVIANFLVKECFGLGSIFLILVLFHYGFLLTFGKKLINRKYVLPVNLLIALWFSLFFAVVFNNNEPYVSIFSGYIGQNLFEAFRHITGFVGTLIILLVLMFVFIGVRYKLNVLNLFKNIKIGKKSDENDENDGIDNDGDDDESGDCFDDDEQEGDDISDIDGDGEEWNEEDGRDDGGNNSSEVENDDENFELTDITVVRPDEESIDEKEFKKQIVLEMEDIDPRDELPRYKMPTIDLLENYGGDTVSITDEEIEKNRQNIKNTLLTYSIEIISIKATVGPTITLYEIVPAPGVRISKIKNLEDDIALSLAAIGIRIIAPIPGKGTIGIEVPNSKPQIVAMRSVLSSKKFVESNFELPIALGKTISNESFVADLTKMPHLLVAGATGQGKSVGLNAIISSLLYKKHPAQLKFVMIDPKKVELSLFSKIEKHYLAKLPDLDEAIITDTKHVVNTLNSLLIEMSSRYELLKMSGVRNIKEYNTKYLARRLNPENGHRYLPYIVVIIDEFADLIMTAGKEVEVPLTRLAQLARAVGIHLVIATQRPSVNIITGTIKANFPARLAFRVVQKIDSRTILDTGGADQLIGRGDMLLSTGSDLIRMQCAFIDTEEVMRLTDFIGSQAGYATALLLPEYSGDSAETNLRDDIGDRDEMFAQAARLVVLNQHGSTSLLQRKLNLGYNRAGRIMDQLEAAGVVGPQEGSKAREVYVHSEMELEVILNPEG
ncbi:DNA translocase FtsK [Bacteroidales bacterium OttesenSCG-928-K03]|nr:DNA translocase FtsK [Odoribacter sp. OttesenSCG-928-L07]MDL2242695.1 DNA translocase FtsK [Bacteroidales bacterium OttesenSCG-928-K03]